MKGGLAELLEEEFKLKRLRWIVDRTAADLQWKTVSESEADHRIARTRNQVLELFPEGGELFDLLYRPRFERISRERQSRCTTR